MEVLVVGGDMRSRMLMDILGRAGAACNSILHGENVDRHENLLMEADLVVLPANYTGGDVKGSGGSISPKDITFWMKEDAKLFCGKADAELTACAKECNLEVFEFLADDRFLVYNAYLTAEGAVMSAIKNSDGSLVNSQCTVIGSGRITDALVHMLRPFTPNIRIAARNAAYQEKCWMQGYSVYPIDEMEWAVFGADYVFNTVPERIIGPAALAGLKEGSMYMELASEPGGCAKKDVPKHCAYRQENSLPGRISPASAAVAMSEFVYRNAEVRS